MSSALPSRRRLASPKWARVVGFAALILCGTVRGPGQNAQQGVADARQAARVELQKKAEDERTHRLLQQFADYVKDTADQVSNLEGRAGKFLPRLESLLRDDDGKRLAQDANVFFTYLRMRDEPVVTMEQIRSRKATIASLLEGVQKELAHVSVGYVPDERTKREVDETYFWTRDRLGRLTDQDGWLTTVIEKASKDLDLTSAKTLEEVIREYEARRLALWGEARRQGEEQAQEPSKQVLTEAAKTVELERAKNEAEKQLAEARAENARMRAEFELREKESAAATQKRLIDAETKIEDLRAELERDRQAAAAERDAKDAVAQVKREQTETAANKVLLVQKCQNPDVKQRLAPFLAEGYWQPGDRKNASVEKRAISLSRLRAVGALDESRDGLERLLWCGTRRSGWGGYDTVRPRWPYSFHFSQLAPEHIEALKKAQQDLRELGDTLVEQKMLAP